MESIFQNFVVYRQRALGISLTAECHYCDSIVFSASDKIFCNLFG